MTDATGSTPHITGLHHLYCSPRRIIIAIVICVFCSDAFIMVLRRSGDTIDHLIHHLLDSVLLVGLLFPALICLVFRPIELHLKELRLAKEELGAERNNLRGILDAMPAGAYIVDRSFRITYANMPMTREFGAEEGRLCHQYFQGGADVCAGCRAGEIFQGRSVTWQARYGNGKVCEVFETPLYRADNIIYRLGIVRDITASRNADDELRASKQKLRSLSAHQQRTREEERAAVSREIHDELGQVLATVQLAASSLGEECPDHSGLREKIAGMNLLVTGAIRAVQRICADLRPAMLDELGLAAAVEWQIAEFRTRTGIACTPDILLSDTPLAKELATAIFRILQEALTNVMRHARATRVAVSLEERNGRVVLVVADNGRGIPPEELRGNQSLGITGMRERALSLGGRVRICRSRQWGTTLVALIPCNAAGGHRNERTDTNRR